ncbi:MAG: glycosyltransferase family 2 protein [Sphingobacteriaceae bacterium]|nr:glycosyltransferase family 2 protein [Sphingobacteriaceae bacterium]
MVGTIEFSVLVPTYNNVKSIGNTLNSIANQDYHEKFEVVIQNNYSTDGATDAIEDFIKSNQRENISYKHVINSELVSMYANHNLAICNSSGKYIIFCHADDFLMPDCLSILKKKISELNYSNRVIIAGDSLFRSYSRTFLNNKGLSIHGLHSGELAISAIVNGGGLTPSGTCYARGVFKYTNDQFILTKHKLSPSDWTTLIVQLFNGAELYLCRNLLFVRVDASTANEGVLYKEIKSVVKESFELLKENLDNRQFQLLKNYLFSNISGTPNISYLSIMKQCGFLSKYELVKFKFQYVKCLFSFGKNPYSLSSRLKSKILNVL